LLNDPNGGQMLNMERLRMLSNSTVGQEMPAATWSHIFGFLGLLSLGVGFVFMRLLGGRMVRTCHEIQGKPSYMVKEILGTRIRIASVLTKRR
jgi:hypothetical protein